MSETAVKGVVYDLGGVVIDWNPRFVYRQIFTGDEARMEYFLAEICPQSWNEQQDAGRPLAEATEERVALFPEWEAEIRAFYGRWLEMVGDAIPGSFEIASELKAMGLPLWALSNWSAELFPLVRHRLPVFDLFEKIFLSGEYRLIKPDARYFRAALDEIGIAAENLVFIDDNRVNVAAAANLGFRALAFVDAGTLRADLRALGLAL